MELIFPLITFGIAAGLCLAVGAVARLLVPGRHSDLGVLGTMALGALGILAGLVVLWAVGADPSWTGAFATAVACSAAIIVLGEGGVSRRRA